MHMLVTTWLSKALSCLQSIIIILEIVLLRDINDT